MKSYSIDNNQRIVFLHGIDKNVKAILEFINKTKKRYDVYADSKGPEYVIRIDSLRKDILNLKREEDTYGLSLKLQKEILTIAKKCLDLLNCGILLE
jgi:hypothetical protein